MKSLFVLSCFLLSTGCSNSPPPQPATAGPDNPPATDSRSSTPEKESSTTNSRPENKSPVAASSPEEEAPSVANSIEDATKMLVGNWEGQSDEVRLRMELGEDQTIIESADSGAGLKPVNKGTWKVIEVQGDSITLEIEPKGKPSYHQTDEFDGKNKFSHKHGDKIIEFVRQ